ncbi:MAG: glycosyltransferase family 4 protein [Candidatus Dormibacteraeota bacterium]|nr:glycosyltransferase family 4 protein [Candidatus Dormibacteraeota bacterium]
MSTYRFVFVMEQTLGHAAHTRNLERALAARPDVDATLIKLADPHDDRRSRLPVLGNWTLRASWAARRALRRRLAAGPADAVFIHTQVSSLMSVGVMRRVPTVVSLDATPENFDAEGAAYGHARRAEVVEQLKQRVNRRPLMAAQAIVTWNRWARNSLVVHYGIPVTKVMVIPPGVETDLFRPAEHSSGGRVRVLFVGGDLVRKGGTDLLEAMRGIGEVAEIDLVTGSEHPALPAGLVCRLHRGLEPQSRELVDLYRSADVFCLPSRGDCFPQVIAEAMACGLPVVATDVGAVAEAVLHGVNGLVVPPGSPHHLRLALEALIRDPGLRRSMGEQSLEIARRDHDARRNGEAILDLMVACSRAREPVA